MSEITRLTRKTDTEISGRHEHFSSSQYRRLPGGRRDAYTRLTSAARLQSEHGGRRGRLRRIPQLAVAIEKLLRAGQLVQPPRIAHALVMEAVEIMARVEDDEWIVDMTRPPRRLAHRGDVAEMLEVV